MSAPIIIIPEEYVPAIAAQNHLLDLQPYSVRATQCQYLVVDTGHISIESNLADPESVVQLDRFRTPRVTHV